MMKLNFLHDSSTSERVTAIVSTLFAVGILGVAVTAQQLNNEPTGGLVQLESELMTQLDLAYRHDTPLLEQRVEQFNGVLQKWQQATPSAERDEKLARWIRDAMARSMPGSNRPLPETPIFETRPVAPLNVAQTKIVESKTTTPPTDILTDEPSRFDTNTTPTYKPDLAMLPLSEIEVAADDEAESDVQVEYVAAREWNEDREHENLFQEPEFDEARPGQTQAELTQKSVIVRHRTLGEPAVDFNLRELSARIAGYHEGLAEIEAALVNHSADDSQELVTLVESLEQLDSQRQFVSLYYDLLSDRQRMFLATPRSLEPVVARVQKRLDRSERSADGDFLRPFDGEAQERLEQLRERLDLLVASK
ncbi:hypothetical protein [Adhaeretor mobilis]|uniref:Uncharacterized protein n=1 Tax=Adhaeretor mobilis TaxID=1930276 RepID=A0A517MRV1_9BACT|nr:hypothetical protein [Adhaeretor mobilis]QDS97609.1 hypothetical protein HG15A2_08720 [Adhaeretor mobilis]